MKKALYALRYLLLIIIFGVLVYATAILEKVPATQQFLRKISRVLNTHITSLIVLLILAAITITGVVYARIKDKEK